jgi:predicted lipid-binding transport protein (Tim44 family)
MRPLTLLLTAMLLLAPGLLEARPGMGGSMGSRGSMTFSAPRATGIAPGGAMPFQRTITPNSSYGSSSYGRSYGGYGQSGFGRSSFTSGLMGGLMGGLIGAGIGGMLFGHGFFGFHGGFGFMGLLIQLFLLYLLARFLYRRFMGAPAMAGAGGGFARLFQPGAARTGGGFGFGGPAKQPLTLGPNDYQAFQALLKNIQAAWTAHDLNNLGALVTPEMLGYFGEQMAEQTSRGVRNIVSDVMLQQGDLSEAWVEGPRAYATVAMRFSMIDVTKDSAGRVVDGSPTERITVTEFWTFVRATGGRWVLSAIQQAR